MLYAPLLMGVAFIPPLAASGGKVAVKKAGATLYTFDEDTSGWFVTAPDLASVEVNHSPENVKVGAGALKLCYRLKRGKVAALVGTGLDLSHAEGVRFWAKCSCSTVFVIALQEADGSNYIALFPLQAGRWRLVEVGLRAFRLADDSKDENGALDREQVVSVALVDTAAFSAEAEGERILWLDHFEAASKVRPEANRPFVPGAPAKPEVEVGRPRGALGLSVVLGGLGPSRRMAGSLDYRPSKNLSLKLRLYPDFSHVFGSADPQQQGVAKRPDDQRPFFREDRDLFDDPLVIYASTTFRDLRCLGKLRGKFGPIEWGAIYADMRATSEHPGGRRAVLRLKARPGGRLALGLVATRAAVEPKVGDRTGGGKKSWTFGLDIALNLGAKTSVVAGWARSASRGKRDKAFRAECKLTGLKRTELVVGYQRVGPRFHADCGVVPYGTGTSGFDLSLSHLLTKKQVGLELVYLLLQYAKLSGVGGAPSATAKTAIIAVSPVKGLLLIGLSTANRRGDEGTSLKGGGAIYNRSSDFQAQLFAVRGHFGLAKVGFVQLQASWAKRTPFLVRLSEQKVSVPQFHFHQRAVLLQLVHRVAPIGLLRLDLGRSRPGGWSATMKVEMPLFKF